MAPALNAKARVRVVLGTASQERTVWLYAPPAAEVLVHDEDGNKIEDGRWKYEWDAENRLIAQEERGEEDLSRPAGAPARKRLSFAYDYLGRRIAKTVREWSTATNSFSTLVKDLRYVYDDWNMVAELDHTVTVSTGLGGSAVVRTYVWGPDIAGQRSPGAGMPGFQEAGGVGGLLGVNHQGTTYFPLMDANGNIMGLHAGNGPQEGRLVARYDYDPFGNRITNTGPDVELCPFGFSTKYTDSETGFVYFGHRSYEPPTGRWLNRDPIGERGGLNLYGMVGNNPACQFDYLGLFDARNLNEPAIPNGMVWGPFLTADEAGRYGAQLAEAWMAAVYRVKQYEVGGRVCVCRCTGEYGITEPRTDMDRNSVRGRPCPEGWDDAGGFHSHPRGAAQQTPSDTDKDNVDPGQKTSSVLMLGSDTGATYTGNPGKPRQGALEEWPRDPKFRERPLRLLKCQSR